MGSHQWQLECPGVVRTARGHFFYYALLWTQSVHTQSAHDGSVSHARCSRLPAAVASCCSPAHAMARRKMHTRVQIRLCMSI